MALTRAGRLGVVAVLLAVTVLAMTLSVQPETQHTVDEVMNEPGKYSEGRIHLRGAVANGTIGDDSTFVLEGTGLSLRVATSSIAIPEGFEEGKTVAVKGSLVKDSEGWILRADEIKTGCPSKYESAE